jgi:lipid-binding SYLF domain-containing protein
MFGFRGMIRYAFAAVVAMAILGQAAPTRAETGTIVVEVTRAGFIVGVGGGEGVLVFRGQRYPFSVSGLSVGATIGASRSQLVGRAFNLRQASDLAGTYTALGGGAAIAGGRASVRLRNSRGVVIALRGRSVGFQFAANLSGVEVRMR